MNADRRKYGSIAVFALAALLLAGASGASAWAAPKSDPDPAEGLRVLWSWVARTALRWNGETGAWMTRVPLQLTPTQKAFLDEAGWERFAPGGTAIWVSVDDQTLRLIRDGRVVWQAPCSTAENGVGAVENSYQTPPGWHAVARKIGENAPWGQVFRARAPTSEIWRPGWDLDEDLVLTRVLPLEGLEPGKNRGGNVDSLRRHIYIHGTNGEDHIGLPVSHGCIRLLNDDVIALFDLVEEGTPLLISSRAQGLY